MILVDFSMRLIGITKTGRRTDRLSRQMALLYAHLRLE